MLNLLHRPVSCVFVSEDRTESRNSAYTAVLVAKMLWLLTLRIDFIFAATSRK